MKRLIKIMGLTLVLLGMTAACEKEEARSSSTMAVRITDYPGTTTPYEAVNIEIKEVHVYYETGRPGWKSLNTAAGVYNMNTLQRGRSAYIARAQAISAGTISQIKIVLGARNTIKTGGQS